MGRSGYRLEIVHFLHTSRRGQCVIAEAHSVIVRQNVANAIILLPIVRFIIEIRFVTVWICRIIAERDNSTGSISDGG